ncbi:MAG TPA: type II secretion system protein GspG [Planctomycetota bacterium]|nr:type II secretion system protein GspG [Planctomycetota bacterium]
MRYIWFACICLTLAIGGLFCNNPKYTYEPSWYKGHLRTMQKHLATISQGLKSYYAKNNRYPDNNEGLTVLDNIRKNPELPDEYEYERRGRDIKVFEAGILSPWLTPFVYENRRGFPPELFQGSPATDDSGQHYSVRVDEGIYVYSLGTRMTYVEYKWLLVKMWAVRIGILLILVMFIMLFRKAKKPDKQVLIKRILKTFGGVILILISLLVGPAAMVTCYLMSSFSLHRRPEMIKKYNALLEEYHQRGVINDATYQKTKTALEKVDKLIEDEKIR